MRKISLFRRLTHSALSNIELNGLVLDLGGENRSEYQHLFQGSYKVYTVNINEDVRPDIVFDLEEASLPVEDASYDHVLLINVLEHIYNYRQLIEESVRVLKPRGTVIVIVPFLMSVHPSPHDYFRYTRDALEKLCDDAGLQNIEVIGLGAGTFSASYNLKHRFYPSPIHIVFEKIAFISNWLVRTSAQLLNKKYDGSEYPLGYMVIARK